MSLRGGAVVALWFDVFSDHREALYDWHDREHIQERLDLSGFERARRFHGLSGKDEYFHLYEVDKPETLWAGPFEHCLNHPTPLTIDIAQKFRETATRIMGTVRYSAGHGEGGAALTCRVSQPLSALGSAASILADEAFPAIADLPGIVGVHLFTTNSEKEGPQDHVNVMEREGVAQFTIMIEGGTQQAVVDGFDAHILRRLHQIDPNIGLKVGVYKMHVSRLPEDERVGVLNMLSAG